MAQTLPGDQGVSDDAEPKVSSKPGRRTRAKRAVGVVSVLGVGLVLAALLVGGFGSEPKDTIPPLPGDRDPLLWPYPAESIWNYPRGDDADLVPFPLQTGYLTLNAEEDILFIDPTAEGKPVYEGSAGWDRDLNRCDEVTDEILVDNLPIPDGWTTEPDFTGATPNHSSAVVMPNYTLVETQPLHVCQDGTVVSQFASEKWRRNSITIGGVPGDNLGKGSHGGSGMTAFGGTIRMGEWVPNGRIPHALKILVDASVMSSAEEGFRWPAYRADSYADQEYAGEVEAGRMGALVTLPSSFDIDDLDTQAARIVARALRDYGAYIVDDTAQPTVGLAVEWGPQGRVRDEFVDQWGFDFVGSKQDSDGKQEQFFEDMETIYASFAVVDDNGPEEVGGAGDRVAPLAPPFMKLGPLDGSD